MEKNVSETCFECGFESLSYFNRTFKKITGENPSDFKKRMQTKSKVTKKKLLAFFEKINNSIKKKLSGNPVQLFF